MMNELYMKDVFPNMALLVNDVIVSGADSYYGYSKGYGYGNYHYDNSAMYGYNDESKRTLGTKIKQLFQKNS